MLQMATANHPEAEASFRRTMKLIGDEKWLNLMRKFAEDNFEAEANKLCAHIEANWQQFSERIFETMSSKIGTFSYRRPKKRCDVGKLRKLVSGIRD
jgi:hypothetical protein